MRLIAWEGLSVLLQVTEMCKNTLVKPKFVVESRQFVLRLLAWV